MAFVPARYYWRSGCAILSLPATQKASRRGNGPFAEPAHPKSVTELSGHPMSSRGAHIETARLGHADDLDAGGAAWIPPSSLPIKASPAAKPLRHRLPRRECRTTLSRTKLIPEPIPFPAWDLAAADRARADPDPSRCSGHERRIR